MGRRPVDTFNSRRPSPSPAGRRRRPHVSLISSGLRPIPPPCLDSWTLDVVGGSWAVVERWGTESATISNSGPLEACRQYASSGTEEVRLEACPLYASSSTDQVPLEACRQYASSGTECMCVGISCYAFRGSLGGSFEASWRPFWGLWGSFWGLLGASWGLLGASWGPLGGLWGPLGALLGPSGAPGGGKLDF